MHRFAVCRFVALFFVSFGFLSIASALDGTAPSSRKISDEDVLFLTDGVTGIPAAGVPGPLCVFGDNAAAIIAGRKGNRLAPLVAAAKYENGRVVAFGHGGYLSKNMVSQTPDTRRLNRNILDWLANGRKSVRIAVVDNPNLADHLKENGYDIQALRSLTDPAATGKFQILIMDASRLPEDQVERITKFIAKGGGFLTASLGWGWLQAFKKSDLKTEHLGNRLLAPMGIVWTEGYLGTTTEKDGVKLFEVGPPLRFQNVNEAMIAGLAHEKGDRKMSPGEIAQALSTIENGIRSIPAGQASLLARIAPLVRREVVPTPKNRIRKDSTISDVIAMTLQIEKYLKSQRQNGFPPDGVPVLKAGENFPGPIPPEAKTVEKTVEIDTAIPDWHSTGLYAGPGRTITVRVPNDFVASNRGVLKIRIGCHKDPIWEHDSWSRPPEMTLEIPIKAEETRLANPFGGPVYVTVPHNCNKGNIPVEISGAVEMPLYVHGKTTLDDWKESIRNAPGPWGELASDRIILTMPSKHLRELDRPDEVMEFWNRVLDLCAELSARPIKRIRPERMVCDRQISAGYMHAGYPIMTHMDVEKYFITLKDNPRSGWGFFHEIGHNHQSGDWTFGGTTEITVNLFTLYVFDKIFQWDPNQARLGKYGPDDRRKKRERFFAENPPPNAWTKDPFVGLIFYIDLQQEFGWEAFIKTFGEYRQLAKEKRPKNDAEKRNQWMVRMSKTVGRNLGPYFQRWGVAVSQEALDSIKDLPAWDPYSESP